MALFRKVARHKAARDVIADVLVSMWCLSISLVIWFATLRNLIVPVVCVRVLTYCWSGLLLVYYVKMLTRRGHFNATLLT